MIYYPLSVSTWRGILAGESVILVPEPAARGRRAVLNEKDGP